MPAQILSRVGKSKFAMLVANESKERSSALQLGVLAFEREPLGRHRGWLANLFSIKIAIKLLFPSESKF